MAIRLVRFAAQAILERMDAAMCGTIAEQYGYRPAVTWGSTPQAIRTLAGANNCDAKVCAYMNQRYGVKPGVTYGSLPADWYSSYANANCHNIILGCPAVPGYLSTPAVDHNFDDIANAGSAAAAATACNGNSNCWGYNAAGWTKTSGVPTSEVAGACFRTKLSSCPSVDGFKVYSNIVVVGYDISLTPITSVQDGAAKCTSDPSCQSFNLNVVASPASGSLKTIGYSAALATTSANMCFYVKPDCVKPSGCCASVTAVAFAATASAQPYAALTTATASAQPYAALTTATVTTVAASSP
ncbi:hypothetical protein GPECTOR_677g809 [Gonium pectorale]|uniref:Uncharacterized protein n=1 Tax=Gonium pectorale TaxID=33097 RepID=A0A150FVF9_GONPE|nr:hypothetical protein GPECTOR_677g809 [Gonium pectorale]|eukprot:KXZ41185.1 hypothetical protein GPECTOR_677g809 [Gonium pectorale]